MEEETNDSTEPSTKFKPQSDPSQKHSENVPGSASSPSPSTSTHPPSAAKPQTITTSNSSPAICNMEAEPSTGGWAASSRGGSGPESGMAGSSSHGTRASELNVGPALGKFPHFIVKYPYMFQRWLINDTEVTDFKDYLFSLSSAFS